MSSSVMVRPEESAVVEPRRRRRRVLRYVAGGLGAVAAAIWAGLQIEPAPLAPPEILAAEVGTVSLPDGLPAPVERFYTALYGGRVPVIESAVISGRGTMRISGMTFPARYRFSHVTGQDYRHHIELAVFGRRLISVDEWFLDGHARLDLPFGISEGANVDQGANLALWAEAVWMPSVWVTDPAARWQPIDDSSARLIVPFGTGEEAITAHFDRDTGLLRSMESMRFKGEQDSAKTLWLNEAVAWGEVNGYPVPLHTAVAWADEGSPWARLRTEDVRYNADLSDYIRATGP